MSLSKTSQVKTDPRAIFRGEIRVRTECPEDLSSDHLDQHTSTLLISPLFQCRPNFFGRISKSGLK